MRSNHLVIVDAEVVEARQFVDAGRQRDALRLEGLQRGVVLRQMPLEVTGIASFVERQ